jgi:hypothetical protein
MWSGKFWLKVFYSAWLFDRVTIPLGLITLDFESRTFETSLFNLSLSDWTYFIVNEITVLPTYTAIVW